MSLRDTITVKKDATAFTIVGGTDAVYINDGTGTNGANILINSSNANLLEREKIQTTFTAAAAAPNSTAKAKLGRSRIVTHAPYVDAAGHEYKLPCVSEISYHPSMTLAEREQRARDHYAICLDAELWNLQTNGINN